MAGGLAFALLRPLGGDGTGATNSAASGLGPVRSAALKGDLDVLIWEKGNARRQNLRLGDAAALPLKAGDRFAILAEVNRPAYLYVVWIGADGLVEPVYPWTPGDWSSRPEVDQPVPNLRRPEALDEFYKLPTGTPGMETLVLLARDTPLPRDVDLKQELGNFGKQTEQDVKAAAWFENGRPVADGVGRAGRFDASKVDDPVLVAQQRIRAVAERLQFTYSRAVSFANQGK